jgi:hypothetical protein
MGDVVGGFFQPVSHRIGTFPALGKSVILDDGDEVGLAMPVMNHAIDTGLGSALTWRARA